MTPEKVRAVIGLYRRKFKRMKIRKEDQPEEKILFFSELGLSHCHGMLDKMEVFIDEKRMDKVFRWLGFIQGVLWVEKVYTLDQLKNHSHPDIK
jgi:hypothetical protein